MDLLTIILNSATAAATIVLAFFAAVQIWQARRESKERQRAAYASLYAEYFHLSSLSDSWADEDLVALARNDALRPEDMLPRDWGTLIRLLGEVGSETGALGGMAYDAVAETATRARTLIYLVKTFPSDTVEMKAREYEKQIKKGIQVAAETFEEAMHQAPSWLTTHPVTIRDPRSEIGRKVQQTMLDTQKRLGGRRSEPRLGPVGVWVGRGIARVALWFDPTLESHLQLTEEDEEKKVEK
jgi:hypothetical protein